MVDAKLILYAEPFLKLYGLAGLKLKDIPKRLRMSEDQVCDLVKYLKQKGAVNYIKTLRTGLSGITCFELTAVGAEVAANKGKLTERPLNQSVMVNAPVKNIAQVTGDNAKITQIADQTKITVLKGLIESDKELDFKKRNFLLDTLNKFNKIKETGDNAADLLAKIISTAPKYAPFFFSLLS